MGSVGGDWVAVTRLGQGLGAGTRKRGGLKRPLPIFLDL